MSPSPVDVSDPARIDQYAGAWSGLMEMVRRGYSWSGHERNRFFLNDTKGKFFAAARLSGFGFPDDGRGLAVVDWDQDGDLDLWFRNRTAPRLRMLANQTVSKWDQDSQWVAIRLEGTDCSRDAIGAVVEVVATGKTGRSVKSLRAGDLFLSQSSKWLHFGLGGAGSISAVKVLWPGGQHEEFSGVAIGGRFLLKQGAGAARSWQGEIQRDKLMIEGQPWLFQNQPADQTGVARIILPARVPMPPVSYRNQAAQPVALGAGQPQLVVLWSSSCPHCKKELGEIAVAAKAIREAGLQVLALSVDGIEGPTADTSASYDMIDDLRFPFAWGLIDAESAGRVAKFQRALFDRTPADSVPLALLLDAAGDAVAIYRGSFGIAEVLADFKAVDRADDKRRYHLAPPLAGSWFTNPLPREELARFMAGQP